MKPRLQAADYRFIAVCLVLLGATAWYSARNFYRAFPEASIDFQVDRDQAAARAARFLNSEGFHLEGYRQAGQFTYDDEAKTFLEREAGLEQANRLLGSRVRLWRWANRWFRPLQKEEFSVEITPRGNVAGFAHSLPDDAARPDISSEGARAIAEDFLRTRMGRNASSMDFVESSEVIRRRRTDRTFTWKERGFEFHGATYRVEVAVLGTEPGGYREYLKVPEQWSRDYEKLRSSNEAASLVDGVVTLLLGIGMLVTIVLRVRRHDVHWRRAALFGVAGMALGFLAQLNEFPLHEFSYPTTDSYGSFVTRQLLQAVLAALGSGGLLFVLAAGAEPLYREAFPNQMSLGSLFSARGIRTKRFLLGSILGITLTGIFIAYQTGFYIAAYKWGAWSPADVPYSDLLNTKFPWAFVLFGGFFPAVSEEFLFRLFAIPFLKKLARSWVVALVLAGFIWGFGHSAYPQQPFFIRGLEVGIGGIALGVIMLRWGILPTLVWHYSVDAMYSAMLLVRSPNLYLKLSGAASAGIVVLPVIVALVLYWRHRGFETDEGLLNRDDAAPAAAPPAEPAEEAEPASVEYVPLRRGARVAALALLVAGLAALLIPIARFGEGAEYRIGANEARKSSDEFLRTQALDPDSFRRVTWPAAHNAGADWLAAKYFLQRMPADRASALFERYRMLQHWTTRYYRPLDREEVVVSVHPETGRVRAINHVIPEDRPGAEVPPERAVQIASAFAASLGQDVGAMDLKENSSQKLKARRDFKLTWEARPGDPRNVGETKWRVQVAVAGDRAVSLTPTWKPPETFERERDRESALSIAALVARIVVSSGLIVYALWLLLDAVRGGLVRWRAAIRLALPAALLFPIGSLLSIHLMARNYDTAKPYGTFQAVTWLGLAVGAITGVLLALGAAALVTTFVPDALSALRRRNRRMLALDAACALAAAIGLGILGLQLQGLATAWFHAQSLPQISAPELIASRAPALSAIATATRSWLMNGALLVLAALLAMQAQRRHLAIPLALLVAAAIVPAEALTPGEYGLYYTISLAAIAGVVVFCVWFARRNWLAYALVLWAAALRGSFAQLDGTGNAALQAQAWILAAVFALSLAWALAPGFRRSLPLDP